MNIVPDYERLIDIGNGALRRQYEFAVLEADAGDGHHFSALIGSAAGTLRWTLNWRRVHRDAGPLIQAVTYLGSNIGSPVSRFRYITEFLLRRISSNPYFWFTDPSVATSRPEYLCRVVDIKSALKQQQDQRNALLYSFSLEIQQVRGAPAQS